jgi:hypothetical protein
MSKQLKEALQLKQFPKSSKYDAMWLCENEMGPCSIWLTEFLTNDMNMKAGTNNMNRNSKCLNIILWKNRSWTSLNRIPARSV